ncbi:MAG: lysophospholipid acyltransferase family protein [Chitinophagaceae bacterium]|nr:lysophospholipid acyltransferase family protein [Chitinophagaceae bacterium]
MWFLRFFSRLPFSVLYVLSFWIGFFNYYFFRYRKKIILENIKKVFPHKNEQDIQKIYKKFYYYMGDIVVETIKLMTISDAELCKRGKYINPEYIKHIVQKEQKPIIALTSHYGNWELISLAGTLQLGYPVHVVYKKIRSPFFEKLMMLIRASKGGKVIEKDKAVREIIKNNTTPCIYGIVADQSPELGVPKDWIDFLGMQTPFYKGVENLPKITGFPSVYIKVNPIKRGYYEIEIIPLSSPPYNKKNKDTISILPMFAKFLEQQIYEKPEYWLWSHNRWKHYPNNI